MEEKARNKIEYSKIKKTLMPPKKIWRGLKNASYLTIGHFIAMIINFFGFIYIARFLGPSNYGIYVTVGAFVGLFWIFTFTGMKKVVMREGAKDLQKMGSYLEKTIGLKIFFTFIAIVICIVCAFFMPYSDREKLYIIVFSFTLIYRSFHGFFGSVFQAAEKMQYNSVLVVLNRILFVPFAIILLYFGFGLPGLFGIAIFSEFFTLIVDYRLTKRFVSFKLFNKITWDKNIIKPALIFSIINFIGYLTTKIDVVMISWLGTARDVGIYGVSFQIITIGIDIRTLFATAFFPIFVKTFHDKFVKWKKLVKYAFLLGFSLLLLAAIGFFISESIITFLFGSKYAESGFILSVLIFYLSIGFFTIPFTNTIQATNNEMAMIKIAWIGPFLNIGLNYLFFNMFGLVGIAYSTLVVGSVTLLITIFITHRVLKKQNRLI